MFLCCMVVCVLPGLQQRAAPDENDALTAPAAPAASCRQFSLSWQTGFASVRTGESRPSGRVLFVQARRRNRRALACALRLASRTVRSCRAISTRLYQMTPSGSSSRARSGQDEGGVSSSKSRSGMS